MVEDDFCKNFWIETNTEVELLSNYSFVVLLHSAENV